MQRVKDAYNRAVGYIVTALPSMEACLIFPVVLIALFADLENDTVLGSVDCKLGRVDALAVVVKKGEALQAYVGIQTSKLKVTLSIEPQINVPSLGLSRNFLSDFSTEEKIKLKCTDPKLDRELARGKALLPHTGKQICFPASKLYDSWVCYFYDERQGKMRLAYAQPKAN
jgi:hypothetical protein